MAAVVSSASLLKPKEQTVKPDEIRKLEKFFQQKFQLSSIQVRRRPQKSDSAEVYLDDEFIGVLFRDEEDGDLSYNFQMAILDIDLPD
jgi:hypothetical protein